MTLSLSLSRTSREVSMSIELSVRTDVLFQYETTEINIVTVTVTQDSLISLHCRKVLIANFLFDNQHIVHCSGVLFFSSSLPRPALLPLLSTLQGSQCIGVCSQLREKEKNVQKRHFYRPQTTGSLKMSLTRATNNLSHF